MSLSYMLKPMLSKVGHLVISSKKHKNKPNHLMDAVVHPQCFTVPVRHRMTFAPRHPPPAAFSNSTPGMSKVKHEQHVKGIYYKKIVPGVFCSTSHVYK